MKIAIVVLLITVVYVVAVPDGTCDESGTNPKYLGDTEECAVFYECTPNNIPIRFLCAPGTYWNADRKRCTLDANCGTRRTTTEKPTAAP
ncbi:U-scoloptoxin(01)-Tl1a-like [Leptinotarsa decemlineata]|uniref:U-scoloptoxin(01)-Tl1a-like n=1 Tax=Leptinotarsa decemlineata TaxID=7539 RepID=UPI003D30D224